jgi:hypothetical protein
LKFYLKENIRVIVEREEEVCLNVPIGCLKKIVHPKSILDPFIEKGRQHIPLIGGVHIIRMSLPAIKVVWFGYFRHLYIAVGIFSPKLLVTA